MPWGSRRRRGGGGADLSGRAAARIVRTRGAASTRPSAHRRRGFRPGARGAVGHGHRRHRGRVGARPRPGRAHFLGRPRHGVDARRLRKVPRLAVQAQIQRREDVFARREPVLPVVDAARRERPGGGLAVMRIRYCQELRFSFGFREREEVVLGPASDSQERHGVSAPMRRGRAGAHDCEALW